MRKLIVFNHTSLDGFFVDAAGQMNWAHKQDEEWNKFTQENAGGEGELVFGRVTYDLMSGFWPSQQAREMMPAVAEAMNKMPKIVFSRTMDRPEWHNTRLVKGELTGAMRELKAEDGPGMTILGSGNLVTQLAAAGLIDEFQIIVNPVVLGKGRTMFATLSERGQLELIKSRTFGNGNVLLCYKPRAPAAP